MNDPQPTDRTATPVDTLVPAEPSDALMARLRAARPPRQAPAPSASRQPARARPSRWQPLAAAAAAAAVLAAMVAVKTGWRPASFPPATVSAPQDASTQAQPPPDPASVRPGPLVPTPTVFLPVETSSRLVSVHCVHTAQRPDEAPQRLLRAIFIDDTTAVGADTDAALVLRRAREVYLPVQGTVY